MIAPQNDGLSGNTTPAYVKPLFLQQSSAKLPDADHRPTVTGAAEAESVQAPGASTFIQ